MISVIIITKDRPYDIENTSLKSLLRQDFSLFEVIVWDASESDETKKICGEYGDQFAEMKVSLRYFKAPRPGISCQRNDAVEYSRGEVLFFIDDDSEVSKGGIRAIAKLFQENKDLMGGALGLSHFLAESKETATIRRCLENAKSRIYSKLPQIKARTVNICGSAKGMSSCYPKAEWLSGCCMAYRKSVFSTVLFNETMQFFGGYATGEDVEFSHRVYRKYRRSLLISPEGSVIHHPAPGSRIADPGSWIASIVFNRFQILKVASGHLFWLGFFGYSWSMVRLFIKMCGSYGFEATKRGFGMAISEIRRD